MVDEQPAEQRPDDRGDAEHRAHQARVATPIARRDDVADHRLRADQQGAATEPLEAPERDQLRHALAQSAQHRAEQEDDERNLQNQLAPYMSPSFPPTGW